MRLLALGLLSPPTDDRTEFPLEGNVGLVGVPRVDVGDGFFAFRPGKCILGIWMMVFLIRSSV